MAPHRTLLIALLCTLGLGAAACSSSGTSSSSSPSPAASSSSAAAPSSAPASSAASPASSGSAAQAITANWTAFFNPKTPIATRISLLQDGQVLAPVIKSQASGLAASASAKVISVTVQSATQATVVYDIVVSGQTALANQKGVAVYQNGTWKVGLASFCGLLTLENGGSTSSLPAVCKSAG